MSGKSKTATLVEVSINFKKKDVKNGTSGFRMRSIIDEENNQRVHKKYGAARYCLGDP